MEELRIAQEEYNKEYDRIMKVVQGPPRKDIRSDEAVYWQNLRKEEAQPMLSLKREVSQLGCKLANEIENITREEFGFRKIGEGWVSETLLYQIVRRLLSNEEILRHYRPEWLGGLELDVFVPRLRLGIEYQGQQHFHPVNAWGGTAALRMLQRRDRKKARLCERAGVLLVTVDYTEPLTEEHVRELLLSAGVSLK